MGDMVVEMTDFADGWNMGCEERVRSAFESLDLCKLWGSSLK